MANSREYICTGTLKLSSRPLLSRPAASEAAVVTTVQYVYSLNIVFSPGSQTYRRRLSARHQGKGRRSSEGRGRPTASRNYGLWRSFYILFLRNIEAVTAAAPSSSVLVKVLLIFTQRGQSQFRFSYSIASI